ncbi:MAG: HmuY family protein [Bacteroidota bacterium]
MFVRLLALALLLLLASSVSAQTMRAENIAVGAAPMGGAASGPFTFYSLSENGVVSNADSASTAWDIGLFGTTIIVNGGTSGPGEGAARIVEVEFDDVTSAEGVELVTDGEGDCPRGDYAICIGSGNGWYLYGGNGITPLPGRTLVLRTADGEFAKVRFLSYVLSDPQPDGSRPRYYTFEYTMLD